MFVRWQKDARVAVELLWDSPSVMARFEGTGALSFELAEALGPGGRSGPRVRYASRRASRFPVRHLSLCPDPRLDVGFRRCLWTCLRPLARSPAIARLHRGATRGTSGRRDPAPVGALAPGKAVVSLAEGWRGEVCHVVATGTDGRFDTYKVVDPSFHNWFGLAMAMRNQQISDFPLCNKSFNLSYCGHDL